MKTIISIEGRLLKEADETARQMGLSRSRLFELAVRNFLKRQRQEQMLRRLNEVYENRTEPSERDLLQKFKARISATVERW